METYSRLLKYVLPYWRKVILLFVTVTVFASLSGVSLTLIHPFLRIVLYGDDGLSVEQTVASPDGAVQGIPLPVFLKDIKDSAEGWFNKRMYAGDAKERLLRFCMILVALFFIKAIFGYLQTFLTVYLEQSVLYRIRNDVYAHIQMLPLSYFEREKTGHIISRMMQGGA